MFGCTKSRIRFRRLPLPSVIDFSLNLHSTYTPRQNTNLQRSFSSVASICMRFPMWSRISIGTSLTVLYQSRLPLSSTLCSNTLLKKLFRTWTRLLSLWVSLKLPICTGLSHATMLHSTPKPTTKTLKLQANSSTLEQQVPSSELLLYQLFD